MNEMCNQQEPHAKALRRGRCSETGRAYLITTVTYRRAPQFTNLSVARAVIRAMRNGDSAGQCETLAWVLMPDHLHWLFVLRADNLSALVARMKQRSASEINRLTGRRGAALWQHGFHDHAVREEEDIRDVARYIVANPLRAGLVGRIGDYPYWDAIWL